MAIQLLSDVAHESLPGKFICTPAGQFDLAHGWPARIERATAARVAYRRLPRGAWDDDEKEWRVALERDATTGELRCDERDDQCLAASVRFVCDTAEEAVTLHVSAVAVQKGIASFRKSNLAALDQQAQLGGLPAPSYLPANQS